MIYQQMQFAIEARYDLRLPCQVQHFVSHDENLVQQLTGEVQTAAEVLLIREQADALDITLYLQQALIDSTDNIDTLHCSDKTFSDYCTILEGVSHFVYLVWNAQYGRQIKPVEMELQAEVDKFVLAAMAARSGSCDPRQQRSLSRSLARDLFESVSITHPPGTALHHRYRVANDYARRYCDWLWRHYQFSDQDPALYAELARFYRMNAAAKFKHISRQGIH